MRAQCLCRFTCSYLPGKGNLHFAFWACAVVLLPVFGKAAEWKTEMLGTPVRFCGMIVMLGAGLPGLRTWTDGTLRTQETMQFDESEAPLVQTLSLSRY